MSENGTPFALVVRFTVRPGREEEFDDLVSRTAGGIREREPGTIVYACHRVDGAPRERIFYELYADRAAFDEHETQPHTRHFLADREPMLEATRVVFLDLAGGKTPLSAGPAPAMPDARLVGEQVAYHRKRLGLSQIEFAGLIGRSESFSSRSVPGSEA